MRKIHSQNQNIKKELVLHEKKVDLKKCQQTFKRQVEEQNKSQKTLAALADGFEKRARKGKIVFQIIRMMQQRDFVTRTAFLIFLAEEKAKKLAEQLTHANRIIAEYDDTFYRKGGDPNQMRQLPAVNKPRLEDVIKRNEV